MQRRRGGPGTGTCAAQLVGQLTGERDDELLAAGTFAVPAVAAQVVWLVIYLRISAPVNRALTAAARAGEVPADACSLQRRWDSVITARAILQGAAAIALCVAIAVR